MNDEPQPMGNNNSDAVMADTRPDTDIETAITDTDSDEDIVHTEIITAAVIEDDRGTQNVIRPIV
jgi:hypothetical protein